jgi:hypothetical protein
MEFTKVVSEVKDSEGRKIINLKTTESIPQETTVQFDQLCMDVVNAKNILKAKKNILNDALKGLTVAEKAEWKEYIDRALSKEE